MIASTKCLTPECQSQMGDPKSYKGLCMKCYSAAKRMVEAGTTTWEQLAAMGMVKAEETDFERAFRTKRERGQHAQD